MKTRNTLVSALVVGVLLGAGTMDVRGLWSVSASTVGRHRAGPSLPCSADHIPMYGVVQTANRKVSIGGRHGLVAGSIEMLKQGSPAIQIANATHSDDVTPVTEAELSALPDVRASGIVYAQSANPSLRSCDGQLSNRPADQPLIRAAGSALQSAGWSTQDQLESDGTSDYVSDNPLQSGSVMVTIDVPIFSRASVLPSGDTHYPTDHLVAFVDKATDAVTEIGRIPLP